MREEHPTEAEALAGIFAPLSVLLAFCLCWCIYHICDFAIAWVSR